VPPKSLVAADDMPLLKQSLLVGTGGLFVLHVLSSSMRWIGSSDIDPIRFVIQMTFGFLDTAVFYFAVVVLIFAAMNLNRGGINNSDAKVWRPQDLPKADSGWQHISLSDIFTDLATGSFLLIVIWHPLWISPEQIAERSVMFTEHALQLLQWFSPIVVLSIMLGLWQLRERIWNPRLLLSSVLINAAFTVFIITLALSQPLMQAGSTEMHTALSVLQLNSVLMIALLITAGFPGYEVVRDLLRLRKLARRKLQSAHS
jgi:hypothetical protein